MALPLSVSMMNKVMRRKWSDFKLTSTMYEILNKQEIFINSIYMHLPKCLYKWLYPILSTNIKY